MTAGSRTSHTPTLVTLLPATSFFLFPGGASMRSIFITVDPDAACLAGRRIAHACERIIDNTCRGYCLPV